MNLASSNRRVALSALALLTGIAASPAACSLDVAGLGSGGAGTSTSAATSGTGGESSTSTGASTGTGGGMTACTPGAVVDCYSGPVGTASNLPCKSGKATCSKDGMTFGACKGEVVPGIEDCFTPDDEDCDTKSDACSGTTQIGGSLGLGLTDEVIFGVAADRLGNVLVGGVTGALPPAGGSFAMSTGSGTISKIGKDGTVAWTVTMTSAAGLPSYSVVRGIATDAANNVFVVGEFNGSTTGSNINVTGFGGVDIFLAKLDPAGKTVWAKSFGNLVNQYGNSVAVDSGGNVLITGRMIDAIDFGGGSIVGNGGVIDDDLFVAMFKNDGTHVWSRALGNAGVQIGLGVAATPDGDVVVAGELGGSIDFGGGITVNSAGKTDVFVAKLGAAAGDPKWAHNYGDGEDQGANGVAVGSDGSVVITGGMVGKFNFGDGNRDAGMMHSDVFVAKLDPAGKTVWSKNFGSKGETQVGTSVAVDPAQNIVVTGYFKDTLSFGSTKLTGMAANNVPVTDVFVAKLSAAGVPGWAYQFGDPVDQTGWAVAADSGSRVMVGGTYAGTIELPPPITSTGAYDAFWVKLDP